MHYRDLLDAISSIVEGNNISDGQIKYARATNVLGLVASQDVIAAMNRHREASQVRKNWTSDDQKIHDHALVNLMLAIRRDLGVYPHDDPATFNYKLWSIGASSSNAKGSNAIDAEFELKS